MSGVTRLLLGVLLTVATPAAAYATAASQAQGRNSITGFVFDTSRRPIPHMRLELLDEVDSTIANTRTDSSGRYGFYGLPPGTFQVRVFPHANFIGQTVRVTITNFSFSGRRSGTQSEQLDFTLKTRDEVSRPKTPAMTGVTFVQNVPQAARAAYDQGIENLDKRDDADAGMDELKRAIEIFPTYYAALERLGTEYAKRQQYEPAVALLIRAVQVNPKGQTSLYVLGVSQYYLKQMPQSVESLRQALSLGPTSPNSPFMHMYLGMALFKTGVKDEAESHFKQAHAKGGKMVPDVHMHLAQMYSNSKRYKEAADELELFLAEMPEARDAERIKELIKHLRAKSN